MKQIFIKGALLSVALLSTAAMAVELEVVAPLGPVRLARDAPHVGEADGQRLGVGVGREARVRASWWSVVDGGRGCHRPGANG